MKLNLTSNFVIVGPSQAGKTVFVTGLMLNRKTMFDPPPKRIVWCSDTGQLPSKLLTSPHLAIKGLPNLKVIKPYDLVVLDDLFLECSASKDISILFTRFTHHKPCGVVLLTQNMFYQSKESRNRILNTHYLVLFKNPRDSTVIEVVARQTGAGRSLVEAYRDATSEPHSYLLIDFRQETPDHLRYRARILPHEGRTVIYKLININSASK